MPCDGGHQHAWPPTDSGPANFVIQSCERYCAYCEDGVLPSSAYPYSSAASLRRHVINTHLAGHSTHLRLLSPPEFNSLENAVVWNARKPLPCPKGENLGTQSSLTGMPASNKQQLARQPQSLKLQQRLESCHNSFYLKPHKIAPFLELAVQHIVKATSPFSASQASLSFILSYASRIWPPYPQGRTHLNANSQKWDLFWSTGEISQDSNNVKGPVDGLHTRMTLPAKVQWKEKHDGKGPDKEEELQQSKLNAIVQHYLSVLYDGNVADEIPLRAITAKPEDLLRELLKETDRQMAPPPMRRRTQQQALDYGIGHTRHSLPQQPGKAHVLTQPEYPLMAQPALSSLQVPQQMQHGLSNGGLPFQKILQQISEDRTMRYGQQPRQAESPSSSSPFRPVPQKTGRPALMQQARQVNTGLGSPLQLSSEATIGRRGLVPQSRQANASRAQQPDYLDSTSPWPQQMQTSYASSPFRQTELAQLDAPNSSIGELAGPGLTSSALHSGQSYQQETPRQQALLHSAQNSGAPPYNHSGQADHSSPFNAPMARMSISQPPQPGQMRPPGEPSAEAQPMRAPQPRMGTSRPPSSRQMRLPTIPQSRRAPRPTVGTFRPPRPGQTRLSTIPLQRVQSMGASQAGMDTLDAPQPDQTRYPTVPVEQTVRPMSHFQSEDFFDAPKLTQEQQDVAKEILASLKKGPKMT